MADNEWISIKDREPENGEEINTSEWDELREEFREEIKGTYSANCREIETADGEIYTFTHWQLTT